MDWKASAMSVEQMARVGAPLPSAIMRRRRCTGTGGVGDASGPRLTDSAERDYFTLRERLITMQKQLEGTQKYINEQCR